MACSIVPPTNVEYPMKQNTGFLNTTSHVGTFWSDSKCGCRHTHVEKTFRFCIGASHVTSNPRHQLLVKLLRPVWPQTGTDNSNNSGNQTVVAPHSLCCALRAARCTTQSGCVTAGVERKPPQPCRLDYARSRLVVLCDSGNTRL